MTLIKGILIPADETEPLSVVEFDQGDYKEIQRYVGGLFGALDIFRPNASLFFHDEGKLLGLPFNNRASLFLWIHRTEYIGQDVLMGDVLLLGPADEDTCETEAVPDELIDLLFDTDKYELIAKRNGIPLGLVHPDTYTDWIDAYAAAAQIVWDRAGTEYVRVCAA